MMIRVTAIGDGYLIEDHNEDVVAMVNGLTATLSPRVMASQIISSTTQYANYPGMSQHDALGWAVSKVSDYLSRGME